MFDRAQFCYMGNVFVYSTSDDLEEVCSDGYFDEAATLYEFKEGETIKVIDIVTARFNLRVCSKQGVYPTKTALLQ